MAFDDPIAPPDERREAGRAVRKLVKRTAHAEWSPPADRLDPIEVLVESSRTRDQSLVPLRFQRMAQSPFAFYRGSALVMAYDLVNTPTTGIVVQLCGDAHLANFGVFKAPDRRLVFDLNDFDETFPGPFCWDLKRLVASFALAARATGLDRSASRASVLAAVNSYSAWMDRYSAMTHLDVWYQRLDVSDMLEYLGPGARRRQERAVTEAELKDHLRAQSKLTVLHADGRRRIIPSPPIIERVPSHAVQERLEDAFTRYRASLAPDRQALFDRYRFVDFARKVVGVGSVGTRCWMALFQGPNGGPLFLQVKEARDAAPQLAQGAKPAKHQGKRVVDGQRELQPVADLLLGWLTDPLEGIDYYVRQLWDAKGSVDLAGLGPKAFNNYAQACGWALARAHARTGDSAMISGYLGGTSRFGESLADFAEAYADQAERDHALLVAAVERGVIKTMPDPKAP